MFIFKTNKLRRLISILVIFCFLLTTPVYPGENLHLRALSFAEGRRRKTDAKAAPSEMTDVNPSAMALGQAVDISERFQLARIPIDTEVAPIVKYEDLHRMKYQEEQQQFFGRIIEEMKSVLKGRGEDISRLSERDIVQGFIDLAVRKIQKLITALAATYELDPHTIVVLEWGSRKSAHYYRKGKYGHEIVLNINLLLNDFLLKGELLHEVLHPLVRSWLEYLHLDEPRLFEACGIKAARGITRPVDEGYIANVLDWEFKKDNIALLKDCGLAMSTSSDQGMIEKADDISTALQSRTYKNIDTLSRANSGDGEADARTQAAATRLAIQRLPSYGIEALAGVFRESLHELESSQDAQCRLTAWEVKKEISTMLGEQMDLMERSKDGNLRQVAVDLRNTLKGRALREALAELFILDKELQFFDSSKIEKGGLITTLMSNKNILDPRKKFARLMAVPKPLRLKYILDHVSDKELYVNNPELSLGASILLELWNENSGVIKEALKKLDERFERLQRLDLVPPENLDEVLDAVAQYNVQVIKVRFIDPAGRLKGQVKTVLMPVSDVTVGVLKNGVSFDGSSITSSVHGTTLGTIFASDFMATIIPSSLQIRATVGGKTVATIDAKAIIPLENTPHQLQKMHRLESRYLSIKEVDANALAGAKPLEAKRIVTRLIKENFLPDVKILLSDWTEEPTMLVVKAGELEAAFRDGITISDEQARYLPTASERKILVARPDPYSLTLITYPDGTKEAIMACGVIYKNELPFEGDFRTKLKETVKRAEEKGFTPYMAPEPEVFFFRRLEDGTLVSADANRYYDDATYVPLDLRDALDEILIVAESTGLGTRYIHHEVAPGQYEMPYEYGTALEVADKTAIYMHIVRSVAKRHGLQACFMPKPINGENGSGMHIHQSLFANGDMAIDGNNYRKGQNLFYEPAGKWGLSDIARWYMAGLLKYGPAILRVTNPDPNSYLRLVPHHEAPTNLAIGRKNRSAAIRVPESNTPKETTRIEYRVVDPSWHPHGKFYVLLEAALQGIAEKALPPEGVFVEEENVYEMTGEQKAERGIVELPGGQGGLEKAIALMNVSKEDNPDVAKFVNRVLGPPGSPLRKFLSQPTGIHRAPYTVVSSVEVGEIGIDDSFHSSLLIDTQI